MKALNPRTTIVLVLVVSMLLSPATASFAYGPGDNGISDVAPQSVAVQVEVVESPSFEDQDWPVIKVETLKRQDPFTGQEVTITTVIRRGPPETSQTACEANRSGYTDAVSATCVYQAPESIQRDVTAGGVTGHAKNYADRYCAGSSCYYKLTKLEIWWTRIGTGWTVRSAVTSWGCNGSCALCPDNNPYQYLYQDGPFTPGWNGLASYTYRYTSSGWPIMKTTQFGTVTGGNNSTVESPSHQTQPLSVFADF